MGVRGITDRTRELRADVEAWIIERGTLGANLGEIMARFGCTHRVGENCLAYLCASGRVRRGTRKQLRDGGIPCFGPGVPHLVTHEQAVIDYVADNPGRTRQQIADALGLCRNALRSNLSRSCKGRQIVCKLVDGIAYYYPGDAEPPIKHQGVALDDLADKWAAEPFKRRIVPAADAQMPQGLGPRSVFEVASHG